MIAMKNAINYAGIMKNAHQILIYQLKRYSRLRLSVKTLVAIFLLLAVLLVFLRGCSTKELWNTRPYRIAYDPNWYPLQLYDKQRNLVAFSNELLLAIATNEKMRIEITPLSSENLLTSLDDNHYDAVLSSLSPSSENKGHYLFSNPYYRLGPVLIVNYSSSAKSLADLEGQIIGIRTGSSVVFNLELFPEILIKSYDDILLALLDLDRNNIDGVILDPLTAYVYTTGIFAKKLKIATGPLTDVGLRLITKHNFINKDLVSHFNDGLKALKDDGTYSMLIQKWGLYNPEVKS